MRRLLIVLSLLTIPIVNSPAVSFAAGFEKQFPLPILSVSGKPAVGACFRPAFRLTRRADDRTPLALAVTEDTPGGAGESIRASLWLAAMVAALDRRDDLSGVRVSLELTGDIDGPSAGAGLCLAILSSLDERTFPADCAATGAIMPDGTIGVVGGIAAKIQAAAKAGIRRVFVPAYLRFETDDASGEEIDLKRLAATLHIELIAVENVAQAYRILHHGASLPSPPADRQALELSEAAEEIFKSHYQSHQQAGTKLWNALPEADRANLTADPFLKAIFVDARINAESAFRSGRLVFAASTISGWRSALEARRGNVQNVGQLKPKDVERQDVAAVIRQTDALLSQDLEALSHLKIPPSSPPRHWPGVAAQCYADYYDLSGSLGIQVALQQSVDALVAELANPELKGEERATQFQSLVNLRIVQLFFSRWTRESVGLWESETDAVVKTFARRAVKPDAAAIERLFYSAHRAVQNTFQHDVVRRTARELQSSDDDAQAALKAGDIGFAMYEVSSGIARQWHAKLQAADGSSPSAFSAAASAHFQAECLAGISGLLTRWNELDVEMTENEEFRYRRTDLLNYLISTAREHALAAIAECRKQEIPCIGPIYRFEYGDVARDDGDTDKVDVLTAYWSASLQAKVLLMLCVDTNIEPEPPPAGTPKSEASATAVPSGAVPTGIRPTAGKTTTTYRLPFTPRPSDALRDSLYKDWNPDRDLPPLAGVPTDRARPTKTTWPSRKAPLAPAAGKETSTLPAVIGIGIFFGLRALFRNRATKKV